MTSTSWLKYLQTFHSRKNYSVLLILLFFICCTSVSADPLDQLLENVKQSRINNAKENKAREQRFLNEKNKQQQLLNQAQQDLDKALKYSKQLKATLTANDQKLIEIDEQIKLKSANLGELFGVVRQVSGEALASFYDSMISAQYPKRNEFLKKLSDSQSFPAIADLNRLWYEMQRQMTESGKTVQFEQHIITADGQEQKRQVIRIGEFNAISQGKYLQYLNKSNQFVELGHQPPANFLTVATHLESTQSGDSAFFVDPSRGTLLELLAHKPDVKQRIKQGGIVGYVILVIGALGLLVALERYLVLTFTGFKIHRQKRSKKPMKNNPLGRIMQCYYELKNPTVETLTLKLDEAILLETPLLEKRLLILGLFATVAPLLGLLGTVMGMIETFQSIALFGTGDPKLMSGGISQALVTTGLGLMVAVPIVLLHGFLQTKSNHLIQILDEESAGYVAQLAHRYDKNPINATGTKD